MISIFFLKAIRLSAWKTKDINIGGACLINVSFASIEQLKLTDTMKYFQTSLGKLAKTLSSDEKCAIQKLIVQFLTTIIFLKFGKNYHPIKRKKSSKLLSEVKASFLMKKSNGSIFYRLLLRVGFSFLKMDFLVP